MKTNTRMTIKPLLSRFVFVDVEVVENHMEVSLRERGDNVVHETQKVNGGPTLLNLGYHLADSNFQSGQQALSAMTNVLVGPAPWFLG